MERVREVAPNADVLGIVFGGGFVLVAIGVLFIYMPAAVILIGIGLMVFAIGAMRGGSS